MKVPTHWLAPLALFSIPLLAQTPAIPTMDHEPHHHLSLHNDYVKVFNVEVAPGDSIILHSHDQDTVAIAIGEQLVTVGIPGKPDVHQKNADAQVRLQRSGYIHSTHVDGDTPYHTVAVELLQPQTDFHNVCAEVLVGQPLNCPVIDPKLPAASGSQALLESSETRASLIRVLPHKTIKVADSGPEVIVALDAATISGSSKAPARPLKAGDFVWLDGGSGQRRTYKNTGAKDARFIEIVFHSAK
jgi:hypothetical protein